MLSDERRQADWDRWVSRRPRCEDCGGPILERMLRTETGMLCERCVERKLEILDWEE